MSSKPAALRAVPMSLFPTLGSIQEAHDLAKSKLPITDQNELFALLATFQNTLLAQYKASQQ